MNSRKPSHDSLRLFRLFRTGSAPGDSVCFPMRWSTFRPGLFLSPEGAAALEISDQALRKKAHQDAQEGPRQHIAGPVDIEVEPGEGDDEGQDEGRDPEAAFRRKEGPHGGKGDAGVAGGKGIVPRPEDQELDGVV